MNQEPRSPIPDDKRLDYIEKLLDSTSDPKKGSRGYRDMRWLADQLRKHHAYIAGLANGATCLICKADLDGGHETPVMPPKTAANPPPVAESYPVF